MRDLDEKATDFFSYLISRPVQKGKKKISAVQTMALWAGETKNPPELEELPVFYAMANMADGIKQPENILKGCAEVLECDQRKGNRYDGFKNG